MQRFGEKLRTLRLQQNLSQYQLADQLGLSHSYISDLEASRRHGSRYVLAIADFFGVPTDVLMRDELELGDACPHCPHRNDTHP